jgi:coenzyme F420-reducing hydrogenase beta subunit
LTEDGVVVGASYDASYKVKHILIKNLKGLTKLRQSKYVQSEMDIYTDVKHTLETGKKVLFSGCPCQVASLIKFLKKDYNNLYLIDLICHGVPSPGVFATYLNYMEERVESLVKHITFSAKELAVKAIKINFQNDEVYLKNSSEDPYYKAFLKDLTLRPSCYKCKHNNFRSGSDIALGDYWGASLRYPALQDKKDGVSLVIIKSSKGQEIFELIQTKITYVKTDIKHAIQGNPNIIKSAKKNKRRDKFFKEYVTSNSIAVLLNKHSILTFNERVIQRLKREYKKLLVLLNKENV